MPRKIRDRADAERCLTAWRASGESLAAWAQGHDVDGRSLHCWKLNLGEPAGFLELVGPANGGAVSRTRSAGPFTLRFDGFELEVPDDFDEDVLQRLLRVVVRC